MTKKCNARRVLLVLVLMVFLFQGMVFSAADSPAKEVPKKVLKLMNKAEKALSKNDFEKALENYNKVIQMEPEYAPAYYKIGRILMDQEKYDEAIANLEKSIKIDPESAETKQFFAKGLFQVGKEVIAGKQFEKANSYFLKIVGIPGIENLEKKMFVSSLFQVGYNYMLLKKLGKSNEYFLKLVKIPGIEAEEKKFFVQSVYQMGINFYTLKKAEESAKYLAKLLQVPNIQVDFPRLYPTALYLAGINTAQLNNYQKSNDYLTKYLELMKTSETPNQRLIPLANFVLGTNYMTLLEKEVAKIREDKQKNKKKRIAELAKSNKNVGPCLTKAIELNPKLELAFMHLGNYYYYTDEPDKAVKTYKALIEKFPTSPDIEAYKQFLKEIEKTAPGKKK